MSNKKSKLKPYRTRRRAPAGTPPGTLISYPEAAQSTISVIAYGDKIMTEKTGVAVADLHAYKGEWPVLWINVDGLGDIETIGEIGKMFDLHPLALEDVINTHQRVKVEPFQNYLFIVIRMPLAGEGLQTEQMSIFLGKDFVLTFQEKGGDFFDPIRGRIRTAASRLRNSGPDYLAYALIDAGTDAFFPTLEEFGERLEEIEMHILQNPDPQIFAEMQDAKRQLLSGRRGMWPQRDMINSLMRDPMHLIQDETRVYLRDCYDHAIQIIDLMEIQREICSDLTDLYLSCISNKMNEIMKVLTVIATIFIPLSFVTGLYGMNFNTDISRFNMPELNWVFGYPFVLSVLLLMTIGFLAFFRHRGWIGPPKRIPASEREDIKSSDGK